MKIKLGVLGVIMYAVILWNPKAIEANRKDRPLQIYGIASKTGFGVSAGYQASRQWMIGADFSMLCFTHANTTQYDTVSHHTPTTRIGIRYYPDFRIGPPNCFTAILDGLYCQASAVYRSWTFETIQGDPRTDGVKTEVKFSPFTASAGLGFNWVLDCGISFGIGTDFFFGPKPSLSIESGPATPVKEISDARLSTEKHHYMDAVTMNPTIFVGYGF